LDLSNAAKTWSGIRLELAIGLGVDAGFKDGREAGAETLATVFVAAVSWLESRYRPGNELSDSFTFCDKFPDEVKAQEIAKTMGTIRVMENNHLRITSRLSLGIVISIFSLC
jgi:hypothetical protein